MKYLLDTSVWLWTLWDPERIARKAREEIANMSHSVFVSAVTSWEIAIKTAAGKLALPEPPASYVPRRMADQGLRPLAVTHPHALAVFALPPHHRDPFDRLLVAQAQLEDMILVTSDRILEKYPVEILWAGR
jgi:PIN domain nuclease of toxin-antitoxin system